MITICGLRIRGREAHSSSSIREREILLTIPTFSEPTCPRSKSPTRTPSGIPRARRIQRIKPSACFTPTNRRFKRWRPATRCEFLAKTGIPVIALTASVLGEPKRAARRGPVFALRSSPLDSRNRRIRSFAHVQIPPRLNDFVLASVSQHRVRLPASLVGDLVAEGVSTTRRL